MKSRVPLRFWSLTLIVAVALCLGSTVVFAAGNGSVPRSALPGVRPLDSVERYEMPWFDVDALRAEDAERELILQALQRSSWVQKDAAELLGISSRALNYKIKRFGITHSSWKLNR